MFNGRSIPKYRDEVESISELEFGLKNKEQLIIIKNI